jgi:RNA polymerase sigma factor (sigma-70 family)
MTLRETIRGVPDLTDEVIAAQRGGRDAFDALVRRFQDMAVGYAYSLLSDFAAAEDAAQEAFLEAYRSLPSLTTPAAFPGWFRTIVARQCSRATRNKRVVTEALNRDDTMASVESPHDSLVREEMHALVRAAVMSLPEIQREVVVLHYMKEHTQDEIASFLSISENAVKKRLQSARRLLKEKMVAMVEETLHNQRPSKNDAFENRVRYFIAIDAGEVLTVREILNKEPALVHARRLDDSTTPPSTAWGTLSGATGLHLAAGYGDVAITRLLLERGSDLEAEAPEGHSPGRPLQYAARAGQLETVTLLVEAGADVNAGQEYQQPGALGAAISYYDFRDIAEYLLAHGARPTIYTLIALDKTEDVRALVTAEPSSVSMRLSDDRLGFTPLHAAARKNLAGMVDLLIDLGADRDALDAHDRSAADLALIAGNRAAYERLITHGAHPSEVWRERCGSIDRAELLNRLLWACAGDIQTVRHVLSLDPSLATAKIPNFWPDNYCGATALHFAAWTGRHEIADLLLAHGADLDARDENYGGNPLDWAAENHQHAMVEFLTTRGQ